MCDHGFRIGHLDLDREGFPQVVGGNKRCNKPKTVQDASTVSAKQATVSTACCAPPPTRARLRHHHEPMGSDGDCVDYKSLATLLAVAIAAFFRRNHNSSSRGRRQAPSGRYMVMYDINTDSEEENSTSKDKRPSTKRTCRVRLPGTSIKLKTYRGLRFPGATNYTTTSSPGSENLSEALSLTFLPQLLNTTYLVLVRTSTCCPKPI